MASVNIYLTFNGNCEEAFNFYKSVFKKDFDFMGRFSDLPPEAGEVPADQKNRIMHVSIALDEGTRLMGSDTGGEWATDFKEGNNFSVSITAVSKEEADRLFSELSEGGKVTMPMDDTFWGDYFGSLTDQFGINWMVGFNDGQMSM